MGKCRKNIEEPGKPGRSDEECRFCLYYRGRRRGCALSECCDDDKKYEARRRERAALMDRRDRDAGRDR